MGCLYNMYHYYKTYLCRSRQTKCIALQSQIKIQNKPCSIPYYYICIAMINRT